MHLLRRSPRLRALALGLLGAAAVAVLFTVVLPRVAGISWQPVLADLALLTPVSALYLAAIWLAGLLCHTVVLTAALPGLTHRRALLLNLSGSSVANVLPLGGAAGIGLNFAMVRAWRFSTTGFARFTAVTNLWDVLAKLMLPPVAFLGLVAADRVVGPFLRSAAVIDTAVLAVVGVAAWWMLRTRRLAHWRLLLSAWPRMTAGMTAYLSLQLLLLGLCLNVVGAVVPFTVLLATFATERVLTMVLLTPGGAGVTEAGAAGVLIALGVDPASAVAGVLLYRVFTFALEIPVGGAAALGWVLLRRRSGATELGVAA